MDILPKALQIEALLFAAGESVNIEKLAKFLKVTQQECRDAIQHLSERYYQYQSGISIITKGDEIQMVSAKEHGHLIAAFFNKQLSEELSSAAAEVLAVVAYRGPITRAGIEQIRGVSCSFTLRNLGMRGLVERRENPSDSRSYLYEISFDFLKSMGISKREELPGYPKLHSSVIPVENTETIAMPETAPSEQEPDVSLEKNVT